MLYLRRTCSPSWWIPYPFIPQILVTSISGQMNLTCASFLPSLRPRCCVLLNLLTNRCTFQITSLSLIPRSSCSGRRTCSCVNHTHYPCLIYFPIPTHLLIWISCRRRRWRHSRMPCRRRNCGTIQRCYTNRRSRVEYCITRSTWSFTMTFANRSN